MTSWLLVVPTIFALKTGWVWQSADNGERCTGRFDALISHSTIWPLYVAPNMKFVENLSNNDKKTIAILEQMKIDEAKHSDEALDSGAEILPDGIKSLMGVIAKVMTKTSYYV